MATRLVADLRDDELGHGALGAGAGGGHGAVGAAQVEQAHRRRVWRRSGRGAPRRRAGGRGWRRSRSMSAVAGVKNPPPPPPPMLTLSLPRVARATVQPPSTGPTTSSSGTKTSLKKTSLNSEVPVVILSGRTSTPLACMSMTIIVMPSCLGTSGLVRTVAKPKSRVVGAGGPHLLAVDEPAAVDPGGLGLDAGGVGAGVGLAEELAPDGVLVERRHHPAVELVLVGVLDQREDVPRGDAVLRALDAGVAELLLDDELLDRAGLAAVGLGPVGHHVAGLDELGRAARPRGGP